MTETIQKSETASAADAPTTESLVEKPEVDGIIYYTDGGVRPTNPGHAGYGFHGYTYKVEELKKGTGCPNYNLTANGYIEKAASKTGLVKPL